MSVKRMRGFTLIEMVVAMVIIGVGLAGVLLTFNTVVKSSADPMIQKQMVAVAEELMEEILLKPHAVAGTAPTNALAACGAAPAVRSGFDDVRDYHLYQTTGVCDVDGDAVAGLETYSVSVSVSSASWLGIADSLRIEVTVTRAGESFRLTGWRTPYA
jgi:MSHA pilin protein MshD